MSEDTFEIDLTSTIPTTTTGSIGGPVTVVPTKKLTKLDLLREKLAAEVRREDVLIGIPERPGVSIKVSPNIDQQTMRGWRKRAGEGTKNDFDTTKFSAIIVASTCVGIYVDDEEIFSDSGHPLTFASPEIMEMLDVTRPIPEGVKAMFGNDAHVEATALAILEASGMGDTVEVVDPLKIS